VSERLATLYRVSRGECNVLVVAATTALYRLAPPSHLAAFTFFLKQGTRLDVNALRAQLALAGYQHVMQVVSPGEFSVRGGLIDLFPMGSPLPYRLDLFGDDIESIRTFDVDTQRTLYPMPDVRLLPAREFPLDETGRTRFRSRYREVFEGDPLKSPLYKDVSHGIAPGGIEYYLPLFFEQTATLADYLPRDAAVAQVGDIGGAIAHFWQDTESRYKLLRGDKARPLLPPIEVFLPADAFNGMLKPFARVEFPAMDSESDPAAIAGNAAVPLATPLPPLHVERRADDPLAALKQFLASEPRTRVLICAESAGRRETMHQYFAQYGLALPQVDDLAGFLSSVPPVALGISPLHAGFAWPKAKLAFVTEAGLHAGVAPWPAQAPPLDVDAMLLICRKCGLAIQSSTNSTASAVTSVCHVRYGEAREFLQLVYANDANSMCRYRSAPIGRYSGARRGCAVARAWQRPVGQGEEARARRRTTRQPSC
jgi:transcription-repair coupling factor (superfamily II helicase)